MDHIELESRIAAARVQEGEIALELAELKKQLAQAEDAQERLTEFRRAYDPELNHFQNLLQGLNAGNTRCLQSAIRKVGGEIRAHAETRVLAAVEQDQEDLAKTIEDLRQQIEECRARMGDLNQAISALRSLPFEN